jgi:lipid II:glycine glycyltransferase (peptidoglycan interpeptide bridge formation enzyme)
MPGYRYTVSSHCPDQEWDAFLWRTPGGHHVQSSMWGRVKSAFGWSVVRVVVRQQEEIVGGAQILLRRILPGILGIVSKGPLLASGDPALAAFMTDALVRVGRELGVGCLVVQPPNNGSLQAQCLQLMGFDTMTLEVAPTATIQIDLQQELDAILAAMKKQTRRDLRHALQAGVVGREGGDAELATFYRLLAATSRRTNWSVYPEPYYREILRAFGPRRAKIFFADYGGESVSTQMLIGFGDTVVAKNSGWSGEYKSLAPNVVLEWTSIQWAKANGYRYYDLEGIAPRVALSRQGLDLDEESGDHWCHYKFKYGGELKMFPKAHIYHLTPLGQWVYKNVLSGIERGPLGRNIMSLIRLR